MAKIRGITIELGADASGVTKALKGIDSQLSTTQKNLKDIDKLLKFKPGNTELLVQKQKNLESAISLTKDRIEELKKAQSGLEEGSEAWDAVQREITDNEEKLKELKKEYKNFGSVASQQIKAVGEALKKAGGAIQDFGKKLAPVSGAAATIGGGLLKIGYDAVKSADELSTLSKQTGLSTDELQKFQYASELVDVSVEDMTGALRKLKGKIDPNNASLQKLGISATNADGSLRDATDVFYDALEALSGIENETERDQVAMELFGKSADSLAGIIDDGGAALKAYGQQAEDLGLILDEDTIDSLNATNDTIDQLKGNIKGTMAQIGANVGSILAPLLEKISSLIGKVTEKLRKLTPEQTETILKIVGVVAAVAPAIIVIGKLVSGIGSVISILGTVVGVLGGPLTLAIGAAIAIGVLLYKNWDKIKAFAITMKDAVVKAWDAVKTKISAVVNNIKSTVAAMKNSVSASWESVKSKIASVIEAIKGKIDGFKQKIDSVKEKFESLKSKVSEVWDSIKTKLESAIKLPHIPLPHFSVQPPGWKIGDLLKGTIPSLSIDWYRKAYDNPVMFTSPTVMATPGGYKGFGDGNGAEIVMGLDKLRELVGQGQNVHVTVVLEGEARNLFKVVKNTNSVRTRATNYNVLAVGG